MEGTTHPQGHSGTPIKLINCKAEVARHAQLSTCHLPATRSCHFAHTTPDLHTAVAHKVSCGCHPPNRYLPLVGTSATLLRRTFQLQWFTHARTRQTSPWMSWIFLPSSSPAQCTEADRVLHIRILYLVHIFALCQLYFQVVSYLPSLCLPCLNLPTLCMPTNLDRKTTFAVRDKTLADPWHIRDKTPKTGCQGPWTMDHGAYPSLSLQHQEYLAHIVPRTPYGVAVVGTTGGRAKSNSPRRSGVQWRGREEGLRADECVAD